MDESQLERVLSAVELIPAGQVASYGDIGRITGTSARAVGRIMSRFGADVPWWRVTNAVGDHPVRPAERWLDRWADEGIKVKPNGRGCRIADHRAELEQLASSWRDRMSALGIPVNPTEPTDPSAPESSPSR